MGWGIAGCRNTCWLACDHHFNRQPVTLPRILPAGKGSFEITDLDGNVLAQLRVEWKGRALMTIVQLTAFDIATAQPWQIMATTGLWSALPRLSRGSPSARLLMIADTLHIEDIQAGFHQVAVPEDDLPPGLQGYRMQYDEFLRQAVDEVRHIRLYLVADTTLEDAGLCNLLEAYGVRAQPLDHELPLPFEHGQDDWNAVVTPDQGCWALLRSKPTQFGMIYPRSLHRLFALDFPVWAALQVHTFSEREAVKTLRLKAITARYMPRKTSEAAQEADEMESTVGRLRAEMNRVGGLLHTVRLYVTVGGEDASSLHTRLEVVRGALPFDMEPVNPPGETIRRVFSIAPLNDEDGAPLTSPGVALAHRQRPVLPPPHRDAGRFPGHRPQPGAGDLQYLRSRQPVLQHRGPRPDRLGQDLRHAAAHAAPPAPGGPVDHHRSAGQRRSGFPGAGHGTTRPSWAPEARRSTCWISPTRRSASRWKACAPC